jgi:hypothetical protein
LKDAADVERVTNCETERGGAQEIKSQPYELTVENPPDDVCRIPGGTITLSNWILDAVNACFYADMLMQTEGVSEVSFDGTPILMGANIADVAGGVGGLWFYDTGANRLYASAFLGQVLEDYVVTAVFTCSLIGCPLLVDGEVQFCA